MSKIINPKKSYVDKEYIYPNSIKNLYLDLMKRYVNKDIKNYFIIEFFDYTSKKFGYKKSLNRHC